MPYCCVVTCRNHSGRNSVKNSGVSYHRFPTDYDVRQKWIEAAGRKDTDWSPQKTSVICSKHFEDDVIVMSGKMRRMPEDAVPTLHLPVDMAPGSFPNPEKQSKSSDEEERSDNDEPLSDENNISDDKITYVPPHRLKTALDKAYKRIKKQTLTIKTLRQQNRRHEKKISLQNKILNDLMEIYDLKPEDIAVLRAKIIESE